MMINRKNLIAADFASTEEHRFALQGILVRPDCTVATDGQKLVRITNPSQDPSAFPEFPDSEFRASRDWKPFVMPTADVKALARALPARPTLPILSNAAIGRQKDGRTQIAVTDLETRQVFDVRHMEGNFPDYERVMPREDPQVEMAFDAKMLRDLFASVARFKADDRDSVCVLRIRDAKAAIEVTSNNSEGQELQALCMPWRLDSERGARTAPASMDLAPAPAPPAVDTLRMAYEILFDLFSHIPDQEQRERLLMEPGLAGVVQRRIESFLHPDSPPSAPDPVVEPAAAEVIQ